MRASLFTCKQKKRENKKQKQRVPRADKKNPSGLSNIPPGNRKTHSDLRSRADVATEKPMDCKYAVVQSSGRVVECRERNRRDWTGPQCGVHP
jgi:hypothetical protein